MTLLTIARQVAVNLDHWAVTGLDTLVKLTTRGLRGFTPLRGGCLNHMHPDDWKGAPWFAAWREPRACVVRLAGYELIIDLAD